MTTKMSDGMLGSLSDIGIRNPLQRGQQVRIPAGTPVRSTHPNKKGVTFTKRAQTVTLFSAHAGYIDLWDDAKMGTGYVHLPTLCWVGTGGYFMDVKITPELANDLGLDPLVIPTLSDYEQSRVAVVPGFGVGYDNRDA